VSDDEPVVRNREALLDAATAPGLSALALDCVAAGIAAARPERAVAERLRVEDEMLVVTDGTGESRYDLGSYDRILVLGGGKAARGVATGLADLLGDRLDGGAIAVPGGEGDGKDRNGVYTGDADGSGTGPVEVHPADHPTPTERSVAAGERVLALAREADARTLLLAVPTGGGSALLAAPAGDLTVGDLRDATRALLDAGATVAELNAVRRHCSALKGGHLAAAAAPATVVGLLVSDVVGDDPAVIASGPTAPDPTTYDDALAVLDRYDVTVPAVRRHLTAGVAGDHPETPGPADPPFAGDRVRNHVVAGARTALDAARRVASERGAEPLVLSSRIRGEAREAALTTVAVAEEALDTGEPVAPPAVVLSGGETTVTVRGDGDGGPNGEFALRAAMELAAGDVGDPGTVPPVALACVDTDGADGSADAAGGLVDPATVTDRERARDALAANDSHGHLAARDALVRTGATGTNVNDLRVLVIGEGTEVDREGRVDWSDGGGSVEGG
jgi:hydroxypyruvate reductase